VTETADIISVLRPIVEQKEMPVREPQSTSPEGARAETAEPAPDERAHYQLAWSGTGADRRLDPAVQEFARCRADGALGARHCRAPGAARRRPGLALLTTKRFRTLATFADLISFEPGHIENIRQRFEFVRLGELRQFQRERGNIMCRVRRLVRRIAVVTCHRPFQHGAGVVE
jgi:hypothetical protein